ncbi:radical SAM protein [Seleniivibrio woodruffii]|uniref:radical SAM protein n=1 Tax=Seleniivibrio woodruffii TaxID=1078050 RepID=UPI0024097C3F|nr:radical SAM/SPASM domain-containing protein [Seleniivibrio woodruffii]
MSSTDKYGIDSHKLKYHPDRVADYLKTGDTAPVYVEISPTAFCNHRCVFCHYNYIGHEGKFEKGRMLKLVEELAEAGTRSIVFAGIGEPLLNPETIPAVLRAKELGIDVGMSTNGALLKPEYAQALADTLTWIRFSFNGSTPEEYAKIHHTQPEDFEKVLGNITMLANERARKNSRITIGMQYILLSDNLGGIEQLIRKVRDTGADYFSMKHFYEHEKNTMTCSAINDEQEKMLAELSAKYTDKKFSAILRSRENLNRKRIYDKCHGLPFIVYIRENGDVYTCFSYQHDENTVLGNINRTTFGEVWSSERKKMAVSYINNKIIKNNCQPNCRHHQINNYLWELKNPTLEHINFI